MARRFYGFRFADGINTTAGGDYGVRLHIAGQLIAFPSRAARDDWVASGYNTRIPRDWGEFRRAVRTDCLPMGWTARDAIDPHEA